MCLMDLLGRRDKRNEISDAEDGRYEYQRLERN